MSRLRVVVITMALLLLVGQAGAEVQTLTATHTYVLGDNDSHNDARQLCFLEAKRKVLEIAGVYIQSQTEVENLELTKDKISSYSAALLSVEIVKEDFGSSNGQNVLTLVVKADVDMTDVRKRLEVIAGDKGLQDRMDAQQRQIRQLEEQVRQLDARAALPTQEHEPLSFLGTIEVVFGPEQSAGIIDACTLGYRVIGQDSVYRNDALFAMAGNISYGNYANRSSSYLKIKIGVFNTLDFSVKPEPPFFAYIQTAHGTTARSLIKQFDSPDPNMSGFRHFIFAFDENLVKVLTDLVAGAPVTIGFNRKKGGPDLLVPLDLSVVNSTVSEAGLIHRRSDKMLHQFGICVGDVAEQLLKQLGPSKSRPAR